MWLKLKPKPDLSPCCILPKTSFLDLVHLWGSLKDDFNFQTTIYFGVSILLQKVTVQSLRQEINMTNEENEEITAASRTAKVSTIWRPELQGRI